MPRRVFIVHGFEGNPHGNWFDWLSAQVRAAGFQADSLAMPNPERPTVSSWQFALDQHIGNPTKSTFLVGHSSAASPFCTSSAVSSPKKSAA